MSPSERKALDQWIGEIRCHRFRFFEFGGFVYSPGSSYRDGVMLTAFDERPCMGAALPIRTLYIRGKLTTDRFLEAVISAVHDE